MLFAVLSLLAVASALFIDEKSDLNRAVSAAIAAAKDDGTLASLYEAAFGPPAKAVPACSATFPSEAQIEFDSDLARVLRSGVVRVGFASFGLQRPLIFKDADGKPVGHEVEAAREAVRRIGARYGRQLSVEFVDIQAAEFFPPLAAAVQRRRADLVWSRIGVTDARARDVDFACTSFVSVVGIISADDVVRDFAAFVAAGAAAVVANTPIEVACVQSSVFCDPTFLQPGFVFKTFASTTAIQAALSNEQIQFAVGNGEIALFDVNQGTIPGNSIVIKELSTISLAPATRRLERPLQASSVVAVAEQHAADVVAEITAGKLPRKTAEAVAAQVAAAQSRYVHLCGASTRSAVCADAVVDAFDEIRDAFDDKSISDAQTDITDSE